MKYDSAQQFYSIENYILQMRPILHKNSLFSDGTADYRIPAEPKINESVRIRFRTDINNVDLVILHHGDASYEMSVAESDGQFDFYEVRIQLGEERFGYYFEVVSGMLRCFYDRAGVAKEHRAQYEFCIVPGFSTPDWAKGAVMYQIFTDRFYNGDPSNDVKDGEYYYINRPTRQVPVWDAHPENFDVANFYGGDLEGVYQKLDYLQDLGVEVIYFNPLFVSASSHKYDIQDYDYIDPHFGVILEDGGEPLPEGCTDNSRAEIYKKRVTSLKNLEAGNELFIKLVREAHRRGMRVILDGVFNHCGSFNKWMDREKIYRDSADFEPGAYETADSRYHNYFQFQDETAFPDNGTYEGWWGLNTLPKLNYEASPELEEYILHIARKWVSEPYCADGWRLDVAADLGHSEDYNHIFWKKFRAAVKEANPEALVLAEHYGDPEKWLHGDQWDTVMNYDAFMEPVSWFLTGMEKHSNEYKEYMLGNFDNYVNSMTHYMANFLTPSLQCAMNQLSNHDHSRFLTRTNHKVGRAEKLGCEAASQGINKAVLKEAVVILMTWPGAPTLYYGDEAGLCGFTDPDNRRTYPWGREDKELIRFHRDMICIHRENSALRTGSLKFLNGTKNVLCYGRFNRQQQFVIIVNNDSFPNTIDLPVDAVNVPQECVLQQIMYTTGEGYSIAPVEYCVVGGYIKITLPKYSAVVLKHDTGCEN
ncbi:MAG: glycoside hydrolase family 13 protein [Clostridiales bacterium]|nr:glycoside hydrolase family 13 protein [Clostridiales bacterium]